jgi:hypothetical protein
LGSTSCWGSSGRESQLPGDAAGKRDTRVVHETCQLESAAERLDANRDGRPDVWVIRNGAALQCQAVDLNFDGVVDVWTYFDSSQQVRRRETDYNRDGRIDEIVVYRSGVPLEKQRSTNLNNELDTWEYYQNGLLARTERDSDGDGVVDQWWEWKHPDCPLIHSDADGDGRPDRNAQLDYCRETGYVPPDRGHGAQPSGSRFERTGDLPTEVEQKEESEGKPESQDPDGVKP